MGTYTIIFLVVAIVLGGLWLMRRRARMRSDKFD